MKKTAFILLAFLLAFSPLLVTAQESEPQISGVIFDDKDGDGVQGEGESAVEGAVIALFAVGSSEPAFTVTTGPDGSFSFDGVADGAFQIQITYPSGLVVMGEAFTVEPDGAPQVFTIPATSKVSAPRFTNFSVVNPANTQGENVSPFAP